MGFKIETVDAQDMFIDMLGTIQTSDWINFLTHAVPPTHHPPVKVEIPINKMALPDAIRAAFPKNGFGCVSLFDKTESLEVDIPKLIHVVSEIRSLLEYRGGGMFFISQNYQLSVLCEKLRSVSADPWGGVQIFPTEARWMDYKRGFSRHRGQQPK